MQKTYESPLFRLINVTDGVAQMNGKDASVEVPDDFFDSENQG